MPPLKDMLDPPALAVRVPPQVVLAFGVGATRTAFPAVPIVVRSSNTETLTNGDAFVFSSVIVNVEMPAGIT